MKETSEPVDSKVSDVLRHHMVGLTGTVTATHGSSQILA